MFLGIILKWLGGGVLTGVLKHLERRKELELGSEKIKSEVTIAEIKAELAFRQEQAGIVRAQLGHPIAWFPKFLVELTAAIYFMAVVADSIFQLEGSVDALPATEAALMSVIFGGMFIQGTAKLWTAKR